MNTYHPTWTPAEIAAIDELSLLKDLLPVTIIRQALRAYQLTHAPLLNHVPFLVAADPSNPVNEVNPVTHNAPESPLTGTQAELSLYRSSQRCITLTVVTEGQGHIDIEIPEPAFTDLLFSVAATQAPIRRHFPRKRPR